LYARFFNNYNHMFIIFTTQPLLERLITQPLLERLMSGDESRVFESGCGCFLKYFFVQKYNKIIYILFFKNYFLYQYIKMI
jgi:hypothetical protein